MLCFSVDLEDGGWAVRQDGDLVMTRVEEEDAFDLARLLVSAIKAAGGQALLLGDAARAFGA